MTATIAHPTYLDEAWHKPAKLVGIGLIVVSWLICLLGPANAEKSVFEQPATFSAWLLLVVAALVLIATRWRDPDLNMFRIVVGCLAINVVFGYLVALLNVPFYMDSIGTIIAGIIAGPFVGAAVGALSIVFYGVNFTLMVPYGIVGAGVGLAAGYMARKGLLRGVGQIITVGLLLGLAAGTVSAFTALNSISGVGLMGSQSLIDFFMLLTGDQDLSFYLQAMTADPIDKVFSLLIACLSVYFSHPVTCRFFLRNGPDSVELSVLDDLRRSFSGDFDAQDSSLISRKLFP